jgi:hypothetical protein
MPRPAAKPRTTAAWAERVFVSASTLAFATLMGAVVMALQLGRF